MKSLKSQSGFMLPILILAAVAIFAVVGYLYFRSLEIEKPALLSKFEEQVSDKANLDNWVKTPAEIMITKDGFVPSSVSIMAGQQVTFINQDTNVHRVIPSPPSTSKSLPEFDSEDLQPTDSFTYSFENIGTFTVSNNKNLGGYKATVIVN
ncbi:hypothetical protein A2867_02225 [Candidatus Daviesbacteria bacterium RIFCSPHIGHO2_01_FULL_40_11]|uniref:EfeO-type cupredoxin-like domain-containing protein n=1 Tax=Candidatus Daviesbacteria bacterium RIFCSPHIGHO2_01_FULL_40_11 TaxID=1797762 RepID=A0A1F5JMJ1_9BACT|nr:MAG: hypothetical protein A2867_02225 [Candidatus Daviesbacteria bacterium RIFCSPHIGHO2_01_FULL_40_11]